MFLIDWCFIMYVLPSNTTLPLAWGWTDFSKLFLPIKNKNDRYNFQDVLLNLLINPVETFCVAHNVLWLVYLFFCFDTFLSRKYIMNDLHYEEDYDPQGLFYNSLRKKDQDLHYLRTYLGWLEWRRRRTASSMSVL